MPQTEIQELIETRIDYFLERGYLTHKHIYPYALRPGALFLVLKIFSMGHKLAFPVVHAKNIRHVDNENGMHVFLTEEGYNYFCLFLSNMSKELFKMVAPSHANYINPQTFEFVDGRTRRNLLGEAGKSVKLSTRDQTYLVQVDNSIPFDYLKKEYFFDSNSQARKFIYKLLTYMPSSRLEYYVLRKANTGNHYKKESMPLVTSKGIYNT